MKGNQSSGAKPNQQQQKMFKSQKQQPRKQ